MWPQQFVSIDARTYNLHKCVSHIRFLLDLSTFHFVTSPKLFPVWKCLYHTMLPFRCVWVAFESVHINSQSKVYNRGREGFILGLEMHLAHPHMSGYERRAANYQSQSRACDDSSKKTCAHHLSIYPQKYVCLAIFYQNIVTNYPESSAYDGTFSFQNCLCTNFKYTNRFKWLNNVICSPSESLRRNKYTPLLCCYTPWN